MAKNIFFLILLFYIFVLLQTSFLVHFSVLGYAPNLILISVILLNIFSSNIKLSVWAALIGGFILDVFSAHFLGLSVVIFLTIAFFIKKSLYYLKERQEKYPITYFLPLLFFSLIIYDLFLNLVSYFFYSSFQFIFGIALFSKIIYNLILGALVFYPVRSSVKLLNYGFYKI